MFCNRDKIFYNGIPTNCFEVEMENESFTFVGSRCRRNLNFLFLALLFHRIGGFHVTS